MILFLTFSEKKLGLSKTGVGGEIVILGMGADVIGDTEEAFGGKKDTVRFFSCTTVEDIVGACNFF